MSEPITPAVEIRRDDRGDVDEVVASGVSVHLERMRDDGWSLVLGSTCAIWRFWIDRKGKRVEVSHHDIERLP